MRLERKRSCLSESCARFGCTSAQNQTHDMPDDASVSLASVWQRLSSASTARLEMQSWSQLKCCAPIGRWGGQIRSQERESSGVNDRSTYCNQEFGSGHFLLLLFLLLLVCLGHDVVEPFQLVVGEDPVEGFPNKAHCKNLRKYELQDIQIKIISFGQRESCKNTKVTARELKVRYVRRTRGTRNFQNNQVLEIYRAREWISRGLPVEGTKSLTSSRSCSAHITFMLDVIQLIIIIIIIHKFVRASVQQIN